MSAPWASALSTAGTAVLLIQRFDPDREPSPAAIYAFRLFGIRTILIGLELLGEGTAASRGIRERDQHRE